MQLVDLTINDKRVSRVVATLKARDYICAL